MKFQANGICHKNCSLMQLNNKQWATCIQTDLHWIPKSLHNKHTCAAVMQYASTSYFILLFFFHFLSSSSNFIHESRMLFFQYSLLLLLWELRKISTVFLHFKLSFLFTNRKSLNVEFLQYKFEFAQTHTFCCEYSLSFVDLAQHKLSVKVFSCSALFVNWFAVNAKGYSNRTNL